MVAQRDEARVVAGGSSGGTGRRDETAGDDDVDELIAALVQRQLTVQSEHAEFIRVHIGKAPFNQQRIRAGPAIEGASYLGRTVQRRDNADFVHLVKRVVEDEQWVHGTTMGEYLDDLHRLARDPQNFIAVYDRGPGPVAIVFGQNRIPNERVGIGRQDYLVVIYAINRRAIISGYQASSHRTVDIPDDALWVT